MKQYLKMADVFQLPISDEVYRVDFAVISESDGRVIGGFGIEGMSSHAVHAINSHDELVADVERLREVNEVLMVALIDFVMIGDRDLRGLELIQPELESAKAAIEKASGAKN